MSILFHTVKSLWETSVIAETKKESISTVFRYRKATRNYGRKLISRCFDLFRRVALLLNGGGNCSFVYSVEG